jgi:hypothetical protein
MRLGIFFNFVHYDYARKILPTRKIKEKHLYIFGQLVQSDRHFFFQNFTSFPHNYSKSNMSVSPNASNHATTSTTTVTDTTEVDGDARVS